jgi:hypothetical protein
MAKMANVKIKLMNVIASHPTLFEPKQADEDGKPRYSITCLIPKDSAAGKKLYEEIRAAIKKARIDFWGADMAKQPKLTADRICLKDGDVPELVPPADVEIYPGHWFLSTARAENQGRPTVIDRDKSPLAASDNRIYGGCIVNVIANIWILDNPKKPQWGKRVCATLEGVQFVRDGDAFGARPLSADEFDDLGDDEGGASKPNGRAASDDFDEDYADI